VIEMATTEERVDKLEEKYFDLHTAVTALTTNVNNLTAEMREFKQEIRDKDNQRQAEIVEIRQASETKNAEFRQSIKEIYQATDAKFARIEARFDAMHNQNIFVIIGVIAIAVAVFLK